MPNGAVMILCAFHTEETPSLRVWPDGGFKCYGCGAVGNLEGHPDLKAAVDRERVRRLEAAGQLRIPGV